MHKRRRCISRVSGVWCGNVVCSAASSSGWRHELLRLLLSLTYSYCVLEIGMHTTHYCALRSAAVQRGVGGHSGAQQHDGVRSGVHETRDGGEQHGVVGARHRRHDRVQQWCQQCGTECTYINVTTTIPITITHSVVRHVALDYALQLLIRREFLPERHQLRPEQCEYDGAQLLVGVGGEVHCEAGVRGGQQVRGEGDDFQARVRVLRVEW